MIFLCTAAIAAHGQEPEPDFEGVKWQKGPAVGTLGTVAEIKIPEGYVFAGANETRIIMEAMQNR